ncbi:Myc-type, basic helix-loop-helix (bHLH) domain-containing protein [Artemisia annua]|uniref:Myc-type, basic helix-loop-helix (BHLH) domain-containing protein n=1 Tax=Artemisia annua TaxID=35608 RepID=A0A2U1NZH9_ARTAN|nr:Myc-type, basic helix-loop-helix (bHLH) domain-containing protein [Artemisia annua]
MKQSEMGGIKGSGSGEQEGVAITVTSGSKRSSDAFEDDVKINRPLSDHDLHILTERERRKKMRNMFHQLHALVPHLPHKTDKSTIVDEAISYIQTLEETLQKIETKKLEKLYGTQSAANSTTVSPIQSPKPALDTRESFLADQGSSTVSPSSSSTFSFPISSPTVFQTWASPNVTLNVCGMDAFFNICSFPKRGLFTAICFVLEKNKVEMVSSEIYSDQCKCSFFIHAHVNARDQTVKDLSFEEIYKQAAMEIMRCVSTKSP